jgi:hypothetical protein
MLLRDTVPIKDKLLSETGWRIPAVLADGSPFFIPVSVQRHNESKTLNFWIKDLNLPKATGEDEAISLVFSYETAPSLGGLKNLLRASYEYTPKAIPFGRPVTVSLIFNVEEIHGLEDAGMAFFFRSDLTDADIEVTSAPETLLDLSTNAAQLFIGRAKKGSLVNLKLRVTAHGQGPIRLNRAVIVGGYLKDPPYPGIKVKGAMVTEGALSTTVSFLGDMVFRVEGPSR